MKPSATSRTVYYAVTALMAIVFILPLVWAVVSSISPNPGTAQTSGFGLGNYGTMLKYGLGIPVYLKNSIIVSVSATVFTLIVAATGGYAFARFTFVGKNVLFTVVLSVMMVPYAALLIPLLVWMKQLHLQNSLIGVALVLTLFQLPFSIFMMRNSFAAIPRELEEAAYMDGCGSFAAFLRVMLPSVRPGLVTEAGKAMKLVDPSIELVACGSSNSGMPTFGTWERIVLGHAYDVVDNISLHAYYEEADGDVASFLATALDMDHFIESVVATADATRAAGKHDKRINLSFDEWNVWYTRRPGEDMPDAITERGGWHEHPRIIEDAYSVTDAVVVGTLLNSLLRHGDRVRIANLAQLVNVIAPIRSEESGPAWRQSIFWPLAQMANRARGQILRLATSGDRYPTEKFGDADLVDATATWDEETGRLALFLANRGLTEDAEVSVTLRGLDAARVARAEVLTVPDGTDRYAVNDEQHPGRVRPQTLNGVAVDGDTTRLTLPPLSWATVELDVSRA